MTIKAVETIRKIRDSHYENGNEKYSFSTSSEPQIPADYTDFADLEDDF